MLSAGSFIATRLENLHRWRWQLGCLALVLLVAGGRLAVIAHYGSDLPYMDQWAAETNAFLIPAGEKEFNPLYFFLPTNEHRVFFTHLVNGTLALVSGQWDARQQTVVNAFLYGALLAWLWRELARSLPSWGTGLLFCVVVMAGGLPIVFENIVWGFQSQFFFLAGFSLLCLHRLLGEPPGTSAWHVGWLAGICALVSMGSGLLAPFIVLVFTAARVALDGRHSLKQHRLTLAVAALLLAIGWLLRTPAVDGTPLLRSLPERFTLYALAGLSWPATDLIWLAALFHLPGLWLLWRWFHHAKERDAAATFVLAGIVWMLLQTFAIALARSSAPLWPPPNRYGDLYLYGLLFNAAAALLLVSRTPGQPSRPYALSLLAAVVLIFGLCAMRASWASWSDRLPGMRTNFRLYERTVAHYLATRRTEILAPNTFPYPSREVMIFMLSQKGVRTRLPASVLTEDRATALGHLLGQSERRMSLASEAALLICRAWPIFLLGGLVAAGLWLRARPRENSV